MLNSKMKNKLRSRLQPKTTKPFEKLGDCVHTADGPVIHIDNGSNVLAVAHLDYVKHTKPRFRGTRVYCPQLDDRLGVWCLLDLLPSMGLKFDVLLTDSEEIGASTAQHYLPNKNYNWLFEFDRAGTDVVMYEYDTFESRANLDGYFDDIGQGAFTDICYLNHLGVIGYNFGVGYHGQHTLDCYADLADTYAQCMRFLPFFRKYSSTHMPWTKPVEAWPTAGFTTTWGSKLYRDNPRCYSLFDKGERVVDSRGVYGYVLETDEIYVYVKTDEGKDVLYEEYELYIA